MRAYNYLTLASQFGAVPLKTISSSTGELEFTGAAPKDVYDLTIADFTQASNLLGNTGSTAKKNQGRRRRYYFIYHNGALVPDAGSFHRSVGIDYLYYNKDGTMKRVGKASEAVNQVK